MCRNERSERFSDSGDSGHVIVRRRRHSFSQMFTHRMMISGSLWWQRKIDVISAYNFQLSHLSRFSYQLKLKSEINLIQRFSGVGWGPSAQTFIPRNVYCYGNSIHYLLENTVRLNRYTVVTTRYPVNTTVFPSMFGN